jgi:hypothetical protein
MKAAGSSEQKVDNRRRYWQQEQEQKPKNTHYRPLPTDTFEEHPKVETCNGHTKSRTKHITPRRSDRVSSVPALREYSQQSQHENIDRRSPVKNRLGTLAHTPFASLK